MIPLDELAKEISVEVWGFHPTRQVKPVHFANGFFRALCGQSGSSPLLQKAAGGFRKGSSPVTNDQFLADIREKYEYNNDGLPLEKAIVLRSALDLVLGQDRATFATGSFFSPTLTHHLHTTTDPSDQGTGTFLANVLCATSDNAAVEALRRSLDSGTDNVYFLTLPLLKKREVGPSPAVSPEMLDRVQNSALLRSIQEAFSIITKYETRLEKTMFLQRVVTLGSLSIFLYMMNQTSQSAGGAMGFVPILLCARQSADDLREASRATFVRGRRQIERAFEEAVAQFLSARGEDRLSREEYINQMRLRLPNLGQSSTKGKKETKVWNRFVQDFSGFLLGAGSPAEAFTSAMVRAAFSMMHEVGGEDPEGFWTSLGRMAGLVYPRQGGRGEKYYLPAPQFLDMLVVSLLAPNEEVSMEEFWDRAWHRFGIVVGARSSLDASRLARRGIRQVSPNQLARNARDILGELIRMGHAREYADDIAIIQTGGHER